MRERIGGASCWHRQNLSCTAETSVHVITKQVQATGTC
jgi:hypothetical protein